MATEQVKQARPSAITKFAQKIPVLKQGLEFETPGLRMVGENEKVRVAMVAENQAKAGVRTQSLGTQYVMLNDLKNAFGKDALRGGQAAKVKFIGTPEQAKNPITGTLKDIADNPELYELTDFQKTALFQLEVRNNDLLNLINNGYGADVGYFKAKAGGAYLPNAKIEADVLEQLGSEYRNLVSGRGKTRVWDTARERMEATPSYHPELDVEKLLQGMDSFKAATAGAQAYRKVIGGLTRDEVIQATHPALYARMGALKKQLSSLQSSVQTIEGNLHKQIYDFLHSPIEGADIDGIRDALDIKLKGGPRKGLDMAAIQDQITAVREELKNIKPVWGAADITPYQFVQNGVYRYFPADTAKLIQESLAETNNPLLNFFERWRGGSFSGDASPFSIQGMLGVLFDWPGSLRALPGAIKESVAHRDLLRSVRPSALADDIFWNAKEWGEYASLTGRGLGGTPGEYVAGWLSKLPYVGKAIDKFTEATYVILTRGTFNRWKRQ